MGDFRLNVDITLMGHDDKPAKIDIWVNWSPDRAEQVYRALVNAAHSVGLEVDDKTYLFDND